MAAWFSAVAAVCTILSASVKAQELNIEQASASDQIGVVAIEKQEDFSGSYKSRRTTHGALFSVNFEKFYPTDYRSLFNDAYIEEIIKEDRIDLIGIELGYKHNIGPISASVTGTISQGSINGAVAGVQRTLKIGKQGLSANIALDGVFEEPWLVPYAQFGAHQFSISETKLSGATEESMSDSTEVSYNYKYGILFQIDWIENLIDKSSKADRLRSSGLENTFIDIYFAEHMASSNARDPSDLTSVAVDPNMFSSGELGLGLKMEF